MTTEELNHYYSIFKIEDKKVVAYRSLGFYNKFFTRQEAASIIISNENNRFDDLTLTILEIFEQ